MTGEESQENEPKSEVAEIILGAGIPMLSVIAVVWIVRRSDGILGIAGTWLSAVGVLLAIAIYYRQHHEARKSAAAASDELKEAAAEIKQVFGGAVHAVEIADQRRATDSTNSPQSGPGETPLPEAPLTPSTGTATPVSSGEDLDEYQPQSDVMEAIGIDVSEDFRALKSKDVPLRIVADQVAAWKDDGLRGKWTIGNLEGALRRKGRGNNSWYLVFERDGIQSIWKLSRGGRGNSGDAPRTERI